MSIGLYYKPDQNAVINNLNPFVVTFDGRLSGKINKKIYIHNNDINLYYTDINISPFDTSSPSITDGTKQGYFWKVLEKDLSPTPEEWDLVLPGNQVELSVDIGNSDGGDIITFIPIWVQVNIPRGLDIQVIKSVILRINAVEHLI